MAACDMAEDEGALQEEITWLLYKYSVPLMGDCWANMFDAATAMPHRHALQDNHNYSQPYQFLDYGAFVPSIIPSKHEALAQCWADVGPSSTTLAKISPTLSHRLVFAGFLTGN